VASGLRSRVLTALALAALVIGVLLWLPALVAVLAIVVIVLAGAWEWAGFAGLTSPTQRSLYVLGIAAGIALAWSVTRESASVMPFLGLAAVWWLLASCWLALAPQRGSRRAAALAGILVLVPAAVGLGRLALLEPHGRMLLLYLVVLIAAADIGAYFGGRRFGRHKLAPQVSPGKTWEGFAAGMLCSALAGVAGARLFGAPLPDWLALCLLVALVSVVGDLIESMFKRHVGLKDSGTLLPGHGGVLDRIDSLTAAAPTFLLGLYALGIRA